MQFTEQQLLIRKLARDFAENELSPILDEVEETEEFPADMYKKMADCGFFGVKIPKEFGGMGADTVSYSLLVEEIARVSGVTSIIITLPNSLAGAPFTIGGTPEQKKKYIPEVVSGQKRICFGLTEPNAGSDSGSMTSTAVEDGDSYILNGRKCFITAAPIADYGVIFAKTDPSKGTRGITAFIVDMKNTPGVTTGKPEDKMGMRGYPQSDVILEDARIPKSNVLGQINRGFSLAMKALDQGRVGAASQAVGIAQGALDEAIKYSKERKQFGKPIYKFQNTAFELADMQTKLTAAKLLVRDAAAMIDRKEAATMNAAMAKYYATETAIDIVNRCLQIHGGYGYMKDYAIERKYRDVRIIAIFEGTSQVQKLVISNMMLKK